MAGPYTARTRPNTQVWETVHQWGSNSATINRDFGPTGPFGRPSTYNRLTTNNVSSKPKYNVKGTMGIITLPVRGPPKIVRLKSKDPAPIGWRKPAPPARGDSMNPATDKPFYTEMTRLSLQAADYERAIQMQYDVAFEQAQSSDPSIAKAGQERLSELAEENARRYAAASRGVAGISNPAAAAYLDAYELGTRPRAARLFAEANEPEDPADAAAAPLNVGFRGIHARRNSLGAQRDALSNRVAFLRLAAKDPARNQMFGQAALRAEALKSIAQARGEAQAAAPAADEGDDEGDEGDAGDAGAALFDNADRKDEEVNPIDAANRKIKERLKSQYEAVFEPDEAKAAPTGIAEPARGPVPVAPDITPAVNADIANQLRAQSAPVVDPNLATNLQRKFNGWKTRIQQELRAVGSDAVAAAKADGIPANKARYMGKKARQDYLALKYPNYKQQQTEFEQQIRDAAVKSGIRYTPYGEPIPLLPASNRAQLAAVNQAEQERDRETREALRLYELRTRQENIDQGHTPEDARNLAAGETAKARAHIADMSSSSLGRDRLYSKKSDQRDAIIGANTYRQKLLDEGWDPTDAETHAQDYYNLLIGEPRKVKPDAVNDTYSRQQAAILIDEKARNQALQAGKSLHEAAIAGAEAKRLFLASEKESAKHGDRLPRTGAFTTAFKEAKYAGVTDTEAARHAEADEQGLLAAQQAQVKELFALAGRDVIPQALAIGRLLTALSGWVRHPGDPRQPEAVKEYGAIKKKFAATNADFNKLKADPSNRKLSKKLMDSFKGMNKRLQRIPLPPPDPAPAPPAAPPPQPPPDPQQGPQPSQPPAAQAQAPAAAQGPAAAPQAPDPAAAAAAPAPSSVAAAPAGPVAQPLSPAKDAQAAVLLPAGNASQLPAIAPPTASSAPNQGAADLLQQATTLVAPAAQVALPVPTPPSSPSSRKSSSSDGASSRKSSNASRKVSDADARASTTPNRSRSASAVLATPVDQSSGTVISLRDRPGRWWETPSQDENLGINNKWDDDGVDILALTQSLDEPATPAVSLRSVLSADAESGLDKLMIANDNAVRRQTANRNLVERYGADDVQDMREGIMRIANNIIIEEILAGNTDFAALMRSVPAKLEYDVGRANVLSYYSGDSTNKGFSPLRNSMLRAIESAFSEQAEKAELNQNKLPKELRTVKKTVEKRSLGPKYSPGQIRPLHFPDEAVNKPEYALWEEEKDVRVSPDGSSPADFLPNEGALPVDSLSVRAPASGEFVPTPINNFPDSYHGFLKRLSSALGMDTTATNLVYNRRPFDAHEKLPDATRKEAEVDVLFKLVNLLEREGGTSIDIPGLQFMHRLFRSNTGLVNGLLSGTSYLDEGRTRMQNILKFIRDASQRFHGQPRDAASAAARALPGDSSDKGTRTAKDAAAQRADTADGSQFDLTPRGQVSDGVLSPPHLRSGLEYKKPVQDKKQPKKKPASGKPPVPPKPGSKKGSQKGQKEKGYKLTPSPLGKPPFRVPGSLGRGIDTLPADGAPDQSMDIPPPAKRPYLPSKEVLAILGTTELPIYDRSENRAPQVQDSNMFTRTAYYPNQQNIGSLVPKHKVALGIVSDPDTRFNAKRKVRPPLGWSQVDDGPASKMARRF
jgi:hypothetical protein